MAPSAAFTVGTPQARAGTPVQFDGSPSSEPGAVAIMGFHWDFGDSSSASGTAPVHTYADAGTYDVTLTVTDAVGASAAISHPVTVSGSPSAVIKVTTTHSAARVSLSAARSSDVGSSLASEVWQFGDGTSGSGLTVIHRYRRPGRYRLTLIVTDRSGATSIARRVVIVRAATITRVLVNRSPRIERLAVSVNGPGMLELGSRRIRARGARTVRLTVRPTSLEYASHRLTLRLRFVPVAGRSTSRVIRVALG